MRKYIVYKITHIPTQKVYIGRKTATLETFEKYWGGSTHPLFASKTNSHVSDRFDVFLQDNLQDYKKEIIELCSNGSELGKRETHWIRHYKEEGLSVNKTDNHKWTTAGMSWQEMYGDKYEEYKEKQRVAVANRNVSAEHREKLSKRMLKDNPMSNKSSYEKVSKLNKERAQTDKQKAIAANNIKKAHTEEAQAKRTADLLKRTAEGRNDVFIYAVKGTKWINKGTEQKRIPADKLDEYILNGWNAGRIKRIKQ